MKALIHSLSSVPKPNEGLSRALPKYPIRQSNHPRTLGLLKGWCHPCTSTSAFGMCWER